MSRSTLQNLLQASLWLGIGCTSTTGLEGGGSTRDSVVGREGARTSDASAPEASAAQDVAKPYRLCDGSDDVRLAIKMGGGHVDRGYAFTKLHGARFLYVTGRCSFVAATEPEALQAVGEGQLSPEQGRQLSETLGLDRLAGMAYVDLQSCPDAGLVSVATAAGYADCTCGCDESAPTGLEEVINATSAAFELVRATALPLDGAIELVAVEDETPLKQPERSLQQWPFGWPVREIAVTQRQYRENVSAVRSPRALTGDDAKLARALRAEALTRSEWRREMHVADGEHSYALYMRDQIDPPLERAIAAFESEHDPWSAKPLESCREESAASVRFSSADLYDGALTTQLEAGSACNLRLCWSGDFNESYPIQSSLGVQRGSDSRRCLGRADSLRTDLEPLKEAFRRSYPATPVEIELGIAGFRGQLRVEDWTRENAACTALSLGDCAMDARCRVLSGAPLDLSRACSGEARAVGCTAKVTPCDDAITPARAADGSTWWFTNGCLPETFAAFYPEYLQADSLPRCPP